MHNQGLYKTLTIPLNDSERIVGIADSERGGASTISVKTTAEGTSFDCRIVNKFQWPFCQLQIYLVPFNNPQQGFDLSEYDELFVKIDYNGPEPELLRLHIRNYNPAYTNLEVDNNSMKINEFKIHPNISEEGKFINLNDFYVVPWWGSERNLPTELKLREFSNVPLIEILTTDHVPEGDLSVDIHEISFRRLYISNENLLLLIISIWLTTAVIYLIAQLSLYRANLKQAKLSQKQLLSVMDTLKFEKSEIEKIAQHDPLTGLKNRAGLRTQFSISSKELIAHGTPFSIVFIDIDFFKKINDQFGHNKGDDILIAFAQVIHNNIRITDTFGRWGGEEFILICTNSTLNQTYLIAEKLCQMIQQHHFTDEFKITASFGVAEMNANESVKEFIERADKALYKAKSEGRNQVQISVFE